MAKTLSTLVLLTLFAGFNGKQPVVLGEPPNHLLSKKGLPPKSQTVDLGSDYETDVQQLIALRSRPVDDLLTVAAQLEIKWRRVNWTRYALMMAHVCSEIANHQLNDARLRQHSERYAILALSHSNMFAWSYQMELVFALGYQRSSTTPAGWIQERREKAEHWLQTWRRLEMETDPSYDVNDRKNRPALRVVPPFETGLPPGAPPSAIKNPKLRRQYETEIAENQRKAEKALEQIPLQTDGAFFKSNAERVLIQLYSQPPYRTNELTQYLQTYLRDRAARKRILDAVINNVSN